ncbi:MAG: sugar ABC transporter permease [Clostridia bacterium]|nr:sugar ABC transporter permease [Clostridia bacterium]
MENMTTQQVAGGAAETMQYQPIIPRKQKMAKSRKLFIIAMLAYPIIHFLVFWVYINFNTILLSFQKYSFVRGEEVFFGIKNYRNFFIMLGDEIGGKVLRESLINSLWYFVFNNFILLPISIVCAYLLFKKVFAEKVFRVIFFLPNIISIVVLSMCFKFMFNGDFGPIHVALESLGFSMPKDGLFMTEGSAQIMIFVYCLWAGIGYNVLLLSGSIARVPTEILEAGKIDGIGMAREFIQIVVPLIMGTVSTLFVTGSMVMFTLYLQPMLFTKGQYGTYTIAYYIVDQVNAGDLYFAAAIGILCSLVGIPLIQGIKVLMEKITPSVEF